MGSGSVYTRERATYSSSVRFRASRLPLLLMPFPLIAGCAQETPDVSAIKVGMTRAQVREELGKPYKVMRDLNGPDPGRVPCWLYLTRSASAGRYSGYIYFCFSGQRVASIQHSGHG
jgi:SmpA / OmlA family